MTYRQSSAIGRQPNKELVLNLAKPLNFMMRFILLFICIVVFFSVEAQESGVSWGVQLFPNYSYRKVVPLNNTELIELVRLDSLEKGKFSYSAGLIAEFHWGPKVGFQTGINFLNTGIETIRMPFVTNEGTEREEKLTYEHLAVEVPFLLHFYQEFSDQTSLYFVLGGTALATVKSQVRQTIYEGENKLESSTNKDSREASIMNYSLFTGIGLEQSLGKNIGLFFQPNFQFFLKIFAEDAKVSRINYAIGASIGIKFRSE